MGFAFRTPGRTTLAYAVRNWFGYIRDGKTYKESHFKTNAYAIPDEFILLFPDVVGWGPALRTRLCLIGKGDLTCYKKGDQVCLGFVVGFGETSSGEFVAVIQQAKSLQVGNWNWMRINSHESVHASRIIACQAYLPLGGDYFVPANYRS